MDAAPQKIRVMLVKIPNPQKIRAVMFFVKIPNPQKNQGSGVFCENQSGDVFCKNPKSTKNQSSDVFLWKSTKNQSRDVFCKNHKSTKNQSSDVFVKIPNPQKIGAVMVLGDGPDGRHTPRTVQWPWTHPPPSQSLYQLTLMRTQRWKNEHEHGGKKGQENCNITTNNILFIRGVV